MNRKVYFTFALLMAAGCGPSPEVAKVRGFAFYELGQHTKAYPLLERAFASGIDDPELVVRLAFCRASVKGNVISAIEILRDSALKFPGYARTYYELGYLAYNYGPTEDQKNIEQALGFMRRAAELDPSDWRILDNLGMFHLQMGELDSAMGWFQATRDLKPDYPELKAHIEQTLQLMEQKARLDSLVVADTFKVGD